MREEEDVSSVGGSTYLLTIWTPPPPCSAKDFKQLPKIYRLNQSALT